MGYRSVVGFNIVGDLESVLDVFHSLYNKSYYINKKELNSTPKNLTIGSDEYHAADIITSLTLGSHNFKSKESLIPNDKKIMDAYSLNFYHDYIKWYEDINDYYLSILEKLSQKNNKSISSSFYRQGEEGEDYVSDTWGFEGSELSGKNKAFDHSFCNLFNVSEMESSDQDDESEEQPQNQDDFTDEYNGMVITFEENKTISFFIEQSDKNHKYHLNPTFLKIEDLYLNSLSVEDKFLKAMQYIRLDVIQKLAKKNHSFLTTPEMMEKINAKSKEIFEEQFSKTISKELYLNLVQSLLENKIPIKISFNKINASLALEEEKIKTIYLQKELLLKDVSVKKTRKTLKL